MSIGDKNKNPPSSFACTSAPYCSKYSTTSFLPNPEYWEEKIISYIYMYKWSKQFKPVSTIMPVNTLLPTKSSKGILLNLKTFDLVNLHVDVLIQPCELSLSAG